VCVPPLSKPNRLLSSAETHHRYCPRCPPQLLFLGSFGNDFNYLYNQILTAVPVKACSHGLLGLFSLALGDRETGCLEMRTSWVLSAGVWREPLRTQTRRSAESWTQSPNYRRLVCHAGLCSIGADFLFISSTRIVRVTAARACFNPSQNFIEVELYPAAPFPGFTCLNQGK